mgnify:CR=1 FL=1
MNVDAIVLGVNRLYNNYNPETSQKIRDDKIKFLNDEFKEYESWQFERAIKDIISDENIKKFPTIAQIKNYMPRTTGEVQEFCDKCERTGYYTVWQFRESLNKYYDFAYRCHCNHTTMQNIPALDVSMIPVRAHNPHPPNDSRHEDFNNQKKSWDYQRLDTETFKALAYSHKMKNVLKSVN